MAATGGAVGWLTVPPGRARSWLDGVARLRARLLLALDAGGSWAAATGPGTAARSPRQNAEVRKVMALPSGRGRGIAAPVTAALVADADAAGVEALSLDCRGNNHAALRPVRRARLRRDRAAGRTGSRSARSASTRCCCTWTCGRARGAGAAADWCGTAAAGRVPGDLGQRLGVTFCRLFRHALRRLESGPGGRLAGVRVPDAQNDLGLCRARGP